MSAIFENTEGNVWRLRISGLLKKSEMDAAQAAFTEHFKKEKTIRILAILDRFEGWEKGADWGDMSFMFEHGDNIEKMAIVGDPQWETETLIFSGAGYRRTEIKFFPTGQVAEAEAWLQ